MAESDSGEGDGDKSPDLHHDDWLVPEGGMLLDIANGVFYQLEGARPAGRRMRLDAAERRRNMVANLIANLALLTAYRPLEARLIVSARVVPSSRYQRPHFSKAAFMAVVQEMEQAGLVERIRGDYSRHNRQRTTLRPIGVLLDALPSLGEAPTVSRLKGIESIQLKAPSGTKDWWDGRTPKVLVDYGDTPVTVRMRSEMDKINAALNGVCITLNGQRQPPVNLVRMFQVDTPDSPPRFDLHGRIYWGFWENLPRSQRHLIQIDGQPLAELDFSAMFARLAYAEVGAAPPPGDLYEGLGMPRDTAKWAMSSLLCRTDRMRRLPKERQEELGPNWNGYRVTAALAAKHPDIAPLFCKGSGLRLMFTESQIMVAVLLALIDRGTVALPIHDGLLVPVEHQEMCRQIMEEVAFAETGSRLIVQMK